MSEFAFDLQRFAELGRDNSTSETPTPTTETQSGGAEDDARQAAQQNNDRMLMQNSGGSDNRSPYIANYITNTIPSNFISGTDSVDTYLNDALVNYVTINTGKGNDVIEFWGSYHSINAGDDNDYIYRYPNQSTIYAGKGDDVIDFYRSARYGDIITYANGDGNDLIINFGEKDTLYIPDAPYTTALSGDNVLVHVGEGTMILRNANGKVANLWGTPDSLPAFYSSIGNYMPNYSPNNFIVATEDVDAIYNTGTSVVMNAFAGNDTVRNFGDRATIYSYAGDNVISNLGNAAYIELGAGNDSVYSRGQGITVDDTIIPSTIKPGAGDDTVLLSSSANDHNSAKDHIILYNNGDGNDLIYLGRNDTLISNATLGNNTLSIAGGSYYTSAGGENVLVTVYDSTGITGTITLVGATNDGYNIRSDSGDISLAAIPSAEGGLYLHDTLANTLIVGTNYADSIWNSTGGDNATISLGSGNDTVKSWGENDSINTGAGDDFIYTYPWYSTIHAGTGNDTVSLYSSSYTRGDVITYANGDGNDVIYGFGTKNSLLILDADYSTVESGEDVIVTVGDGRITLAGTNNGNGVNIFGSDPNHFDTSNIGSVVSNSVDATLITGTGYADSIYNTGSSVSIDVSDGNDTIENRYVNNVSVTGGAGNDSINNYSAWYSTVDAGDGKDTILVSYRAYNDSLNAGAGDDLISLNSASDIGNYGGNTITGGAGNDTFFDNPTASLGNVYQYANGDGNDIIYNFGTLNTLSVDDYYWTEASDSDMLVHVGDGTITLVGAGVNDRNDIHIMGRIIRNTTAYTLIAGTSNNDSVYNGYTSEGHTTIATDDGNDTVTNYGDTVVIDLGAGNDSLYTSSYYGTIRAGTGDDTISLGYGHDNIVQYLNGDGNDVIYNLGAANTLVIADADFDTAVSEDGYNVVVTVKDDTGNNTGTIILAGAASIGANIQSPYRTVETRTYDGGRIITNYTADTLLAGTSNSDSVYNASAGEDVTIATGDGNDTVSNYGDTVAIDLGAGNDSLYSYSEDGTIRAGAGNDTVSLSSYARNNIIQHFNGDGNDVIYNLGVENTLSIADTDFTTTASGEDVIVTAGYETITLVGANKSVGFNIQSPYQTLQTAVNILKNTVAGNFIVGTDSFDSIYNSYAGDSVVINVLAGDDTVENNGDNVTIYSYAGNNEIENWGSTVSIDLGAGDDSIYSYGDDNTIKTGTGDDTISLSSYSDDNVIVYNSGDGNDIIYNFSSDDTLSISGGSYSTAVSGEDIIVTVGDGTITLAGASSLSSVNINSAYSYSDEGGLYIDNYTANTLLTGTSYADSIWNHASISNVTINTYAGNDTLKVWGNHNSIDAGEGDDYIYNYPWYSTIHAGTGNDTVSLYSSSSYGDVITYTNGDGNDIIYNLGSKNTLSIAGADYSTTASGSDVLVQVGDGTITLAGALSGGYYIQGINGTVSLAGGSSSSSSSSSGGSDTIVSSSGVTLSNSTAESVITGTAFADSIYNSGNSVTVDAGDGNDTIYSGNGNYASIYAGAGNDSIRNYGIRQTLRGGDGNDTIYSFSYNDLIDGGAGNDSVSIGSGVYENTISGGTGDDTIYGPGSTYSGNTFTYDNGDGNDIIYNFSSNDTLSISGGSYSTAVSGSDFVVNVGSGSITLIDAASLASSLNIQGTQASTSSADAIYDSDTQLWGGFGTDTETLVGGTEAFVDASANGFVNFGDTALSDMVALNDLGGSTATFFNTGNVLATNTDSVSTAFTLADDSAHR